MWKTALNTMTSLHAVLQRGATVIAALGLLLFSMQALAANGALFVSQNTPLTMTAGEKYTVTIGMKNNGTVSWTTAGAYALGVKNPDGNGTWGISSVPVAGTYGVNTQKNFSIVVTAPSQPGSYNFQWQMMQAGAYFGDVTPNMVVDVVAPVYDAAFVSQGAATSVNAATSRSFSVTLKNTGNTTWNTTDYVLTPVGDAGSWAVVTAPAAATVAPGAQRTFSFTLKSPVELGYYDMQWQMKRQGVFFGEPSTPLRIAVMGAAPAVSVASPTAGQVFTAAQNKIQVPVRVTAVPTGVATVTKIQLMVYTDAYYELESVAGDVFDQTVEISSGYKTLYFRATDSFNKYTQVAVNISSIADAATMSAQTVPAKMIPGQPYDVSITMKNSGGTTWYPATHRLTSQNPVDNMNWGMNSMPLTQEVPPGGTATFNATVNAPDTVGTHYFQWRMRETTRGLFGTASTNVGVVVARPLPVVTMSAPVDNETYSTPAGESAAVTVRGSAVLADGATMRTLELLDGTAVIHTATTNSIDTTLVLAPGAHPLKLRATDNWGVVGVSTIADVKVNSNGAAFVVQSVPASMTAGAAFTAYVNMRNTGSTTWVPLSATNPQGYALAPQNPSENSVWRARVPVGTSIAPGGSQSIYVSGTAPSTPGVYNFQWQMVQEGRENFGPVTPAVQVTVKPELPVAVLDTPVTGGKAIATAGKASVAFSGSATAGPGGKIVKVELMDSTVVLATADGDRIEGTVQLASGTRSLRIRATDNYGQTALSPISTVLVVLNSATFVSKSVPSTMVAGETYDVVVTMRNASNWTWTAEDGYRLGVQPEGNQIWGISSVPVSVPVPYNTTEAFNIKVVAPTTPGSYAFQWQMERDGHEWFGAKSTAQTVVVTVAPSTVTLTSPTANATFVDTQLVTMVPVRGSAQAAPGATITTLELLDGDVAIRTMEGANFDMMVAVATGPHTFKLRATDSRGIKTVSAPVQITVLRQNASYISQNVPATMVSDDRYAVSVTMRNNGTTTWQPFDPATRAGTALGSINPTDNTLWRADNRVPLTAAVPPGANAVFNFDVIAPKAAGAHNFQWKLVDSALGHFGEDAPNVAVTVTSPALPTATLAATPTSTRVEAGQSASIALTGSGVQTVGNVTRLEVFSDSGTGYAATPLLTLNGNAASLALDQSIALPYGSHRLKLRATDGGGRTGESEPVVVTVSDTRLMGGVTGIRTVGEKVELGIWIRQDPAAAPLQYEVYVNAPSALGGTLIAAGTLGVTDAVQSSSRMMKRIQETEQDYWIDLAEANTQYPGAPVYPEVIPPGGGAPMVLASDGNAPVVPGTLRIGLTSPTASNNDHVRSPNPAFLRAVVSGFTGMLDRVQFNVDGTLMTAARDEATPETGPAAAYALSLPGLAPRTAPYKVFAKVKQGAKELRSEERLFYVVEPNTVDLLTPSENQALSAGKPFTLSAQPFGDVTAVQAVSFYADGQLVGTGTASGGIWTYGWTPVKAGTYVLSARSFDGSGATLSQSTSVTVNVTEVLAPAGLLPVLVVPPHLDNPDAGTLPGKLAVGNDGAAKYSIPVVVPPGTAGMHPSLALSYSSNSGNGMMGLGWSLSGLPAVHRCAKTIAQDGVPGRVGFDKADRLCLDGQRLIRRSGAPSTSVADEDAKYWAEDAEYRTELDNFTRITRVLNGTVFKVEPKSGEVYYYGAGSTTGSVSRIPAQGRTDGQPLVWALGKVQDRSGNYMEIDYQVAADTGEYLPTQIRYGGFVPNTAAPEAGDILAPDLAVHFAYEARSDAQVLYVGGSRNDLRSRLTHVRTYVGTAADGSGGTLARDYELHYTTSRTSGRSQIDWVQVCAVAAGSGNCEKLPKTTFNWGDDEAPIFQPLPIAPFALPEFGVPGTGHRPALQMKARLDGSGITNFVAFDMAGCGMTDEPNCWAIPIDTPYATRKLRVRLSTGTEVDSTVDYAPTGMEFGTHEGPSAIQFGDFNGDGRDDLMVRQDTFGVVKWAVCLNTSPSNSVIAFSCLPGGTGAPTMVELRSDSRMHILTAFNSEGKGTDCYYADGTGAMKCDELKLNELAPLPLLVQSTGGKLADYSFFKPVGINLGRQSPSDLYSVWKVEVPAADPGNAMENRCARDPVTWQIVCQPIDVVQGITVCFNTQDGLSCQAAYQARSVGNVMVKLGAPQSAGDLNGDGLTDFIYTLGRPVAVTNYGTVETPLAETGREGVYVCLSKENGVDCQRDANTSFPNPNSTDALATGTFDDFRGDGVARILFDYKAPDSADIKSRLCHYAAVGFTCAEMPYVGTDVLDMEPVYLNDSGVAAFLKKTVDKVDGKQGWQAMSFAGPASQDRLRSVTNGTGYGQEVSYARGDDGMYRRLALIDGAEQVPAYPLISVAPGVMVKQIRNSNGAGGWLSENFNYQGNMADAHGRGELGFALIRVADVQSSITTETTFSQAMPYVGMAKRSRRYIAGCNLSDTSNLFGQQLPALASGAVSYFAFVKQSETQSKDLDCSDLGSVKTESAYTDGVGNLNELTITASGDNKTFVSKTSTRYFDTVVENAHLIGLPVSVTVSKTDHDSGSLTRKAAYTYNAGTGLLETETIEPDTELLRVSKTYQRGNRFGLVDKQILEWSDPACADPKWPETACTKARKVTASSTRYETNGRFPNLLTNALGQSEGRAYDAATGALKTSTDLNGLVTTWTTDGFGRVTKLLGADGSETRYYYKRCSATLCPQVPTAFALQITEQFHGSTRIAVPQMQYFDGAGHPLRSQTVGFDGNWDYVDRQYDGIGRLSWISQPVDYEVTAPPLARRLAYDDLNRVTSVVTLDDSGAEVESTISYQGYKRTLTRGSNQQGNARQPRTETYDALRRLRTVVDALDGLTALDYDPFGNLSKTKDPNGNVIKVEYDSLGRKTALNDPDLGLIKYELDPVGRPWAQSSPEQRAAAQKTYFAYDPLGRMTARYEPDLNSYWLYDTASNGVGQLAETYTGTAATKDYQRLHTYDVHGRPSLTTQFLSGGKYTSLAEYDAWGRPMGEVYQRDAAPAKRFDMRYNDKGYLEQVLRGTLVLWKATGQNAAGRLTSATLGNGLLESREYYPETGRLKGVKLVGEGNVRRLQEAYTYDVLGKLSERNQQWASDGFIEFFEYDKLNRLSSSKLGNDEQAYTYHADGSLKTKSGVGTGEYKYPVQGAAAVQPHAVSSIDGIPGAFVYDKNGNQTSAPFGRTAEWTSFDMPRKISKGGKFSSFYYGPEHQRIRQDRSDGTTTLYAGVQEVEYAGTQVTVKTYWPLDLGLEIERPDQTTEFHWMHRDRLGSVVAATGLDGALRTEGKLAYDPWGKRRMLTSSGVPDSIDGVIDSKGYTGHEMLDQLDLVHMNGRVYDPFTGKFLSGDPHLQDPVDGQSYNRYSYVLNNPANLTDPTGFDSFDGVQVQVPGIRLPVGPIGIQYMPGSVMGFGFFGEGNFYAKTTNSGPAAKRNTKSANSGFLEWLKRVYAGEGGAAAEFQQGGQYEVNPMGDPVNPNHPGVGAAQVAAGTVLAGAVVAVAPEVIPLVRIVGKRLGQEAEAAWSVPKEASNKFPESWGSGVPNNKGIGQRWQDPKNPGNGVRIDKGNPLNSQPVQQVDHVVVRHNGQVIGRNGKPIEGSIKQNPEAAHIPLSEYLKWETWFSK